MGRDFWVLYLWLLSGLLLCQEVLGLGLLVLGQRHHVLVVWAGRTGRACVDGWDGTVWPAFTQSMTSLSSLSSFSSSTFVVFTYLSPPEHDTTSYAEDDLYFLCLPSHASLLSFPSRIMMTLKTREQEEERAIW
jgi:hypothetical protein